MITHSNVELPEYEYTNTGILAYVRINTFIKTETIVDDDTKESYKDYIYDTNSFTVNPAEITEDDIKNNISYYKYYENTEYSINDRITAIEEALDYILMGDVE